jgi:sec-independent protein translocase protein TatC
MGRSEDLFQDAPMSFGDHLDDLRIHLIRALIGLAIGVVVALCFGQHVVNFVRKPIDNALQRRNLKKFVVEDIGQKSIYDWIGIYLSKPKGNESAESPSTTHQVDQIAPVLTSAATPAVAPTASSTAPHATSQSSSSHVSSQIPDGQPQTPVLDNVREAKLHGTALKVDMNVYELAEALHGVDAKAFPEPKPEFKDRTFTITVAAPEFEIFRDAALRSMKPVALNVQEPFMSFLKVSTVAGFLLASPWIFYQVWMFVAVGLYQNERRFVYSYGALSLILFTTGSAFCFYLVFPLVLDFLLSYNDWLGVEPQIRLSEWISFALILPVMFGVSFQLPLVMVFLDKLDLVTAKMFREQRRMAILVIAFLSMVLTPSEPYSMMLMMVPLLILYELGIVMCHTTKANSDPFAQSA